MSDENKKSDANEADAAKKTASANKTETTKKSETTSNKVSAKSHQDNDTPDKKKKVIEKLQAMGVMSGTKKSSATSNDSGKGRSSKLLLASVLAVIVVGSFVWVLNKDATNEPVALTSNDNPLNSQVMPSAYSGVVQPSSAMQQRNNMGYPAYNYEQQQQRAQQQREQQNKWLQQQQQAQQQQIAERQKWAEQWQQAQEQQKEQQKAQQKAQQQKWAEQWQQAQEQNKAQQQKWAQQQQQAQQQQRAQQEAWAQQQQQAWAQQQQQRTPQQPYYANPSIDNQGQPVPPAFYNNTPYYQQPGPYYGRQY